MHCRLVVTPSERNKNDKIVTRKLSIQQPLFYASSVCSKLGSRFEGERGVAYLVIIKCEFLP